MRGFLLAATSAAAAAAPIIGGWGKFKYQYMPDLMKLPAGANAVNCHGLVTDSAANIYLTYENDGGKTDSNCLVRWMPDGTSPDGMPTGVVYFAVACRNAQKNGDER